MDSRTGSRRSFEDSRDWMRPASSSSSSSLSSTMSRDSRDREAAVRSPTSVDIRQLALEQLERDEGPSGRLLARARNALAPGNSPGSLAPIAHKMHMRQRASVLGDRVTPRMDPHMLRKIASAPDSQQLYFRDTVSPVPPSYSPFSSPTKVRAHRRSSLKAPSTIAENGRHSPLGMDLPGGRRTARVLRGLRSSVNEFPSATASRYRDGEDLGDERDSESEWERPPSAAGQSRFDNRVLGFDHTELARDLRYIIKRKAKGGVAKLLDELGATGSANILLDSVVLPSGRTVLQEAVFYGLAEIVNEVLDFGVDVDFVSNDKGQYHGAPLSIACKLGLVEIVGVLVERGASVHVVDKDQYTPLHHACEEGHLECARLVLQRGASIRARTKEGMTPMQLASTADIRDLFNFSSTLSDHPPSQKKEKGAIETGQDTKEEEGDGKDTEKKKEALEEVVLERPRGDSMFRKSSKRIESGEILWKKGELLGEGAYGRVYAGLNHETGQIMAVKQIAVDTENEKHTEHLKALQREIEFYKTLKHEHIVEYYGAYLDKGQQLMYVFLEYVACGSISSMLKRFGFFTEALVKIYTKQILAGLVFLHENKTIHRDIKGANLLIDSSGSVKLADFGASRRYANAENSGSHLSNSKSIMGSVYWMAPEVMKGIGHGRNADIWSLGCTVVEMLTGKHPWKEYDNTWTAMFQIAKSESGPSLPKNISQDAREFLQLCFQLDPTKRASAAELLQTRFCTEQ